MEALTLPNRAVKFFGAAGSIVAYRQSTPAMTESASPTSSHISKHISIGVSSPLRPAISDDHADPGHCLYRRDPFGQGANEFGGLGVHAI